MLDNTTGFPCINVVKEEAPKDDEYSSPKPSFKQPKDIGQLTKPPIDHTPAKPVIEQVKDQKLAQLLASVKAKAKELAVDIEEKAPRKPRQTKASTPSIREVPVKFEPKHIINDADWIKQTRHSNIHDPETKCLFWANGGAKHLIGGLNYAQAFENLKREKLASINGLKAAEYQRVVPLAPNTKTFTSGVPTERDRVARAFAGEAAMKRRADRLWMQKDIAEGKGNRKTS